MKRIQKNTITKPKEKRPSIPRDVQLKLWIYSGGRCEFPGCNKPLWKDGLTLKEDNYSNIAHIISWTPDGPRGNKKLSLKLSKDFSNLMLMCQKHNKLIDGKNKNYYTTDLLKGFKDAHEERIRILTDIQSDSKTTVIRFKANIGERKVDIPIHQTYEAIFPKYPSDDKGMLVDMTPLGNINNKMSIKTASEQIQKRINNFLTIGNDEKKICHLSVFAMGPLPLLVQLGHSLSNTIPADIYQRHRDADNWMWKNGCDENFRYNMQRRNIKSSDKNVVLVLSLSGKIHNQEIKKALNKKLATYEITIDNPSTTFLDFKDKLEKFREIYRKTLAEIRRNHGENCIINLFLAAPVPIAVTCGRELIHKADPKMIIYDLNEKGNFVPILKIN